MASTFRTAVYKFIGEDNPAIDTPRFLDLLTKLPSTNSIIELGGNVRLSTVYGNNYAGHIVITKPVSINGNGYTITYTDSSTVLRWCNNVNYLSYQFGTGGGTGLGGAVVGGISAFGDSFAVPASVPLSYGDIFLIYAENSITTGVVPHATNVYYPGEIHRVSEVSGGTCYFTDFVADTMTTNVKAYKMTMNSGVFIKDVNFTRTSAPSSYITPGLDLRHLVDFNVDNVNFFDCGMLNILQCISGRISNCKFFNDMAAIVTYGNEISCSNGVIYSNNESHGFRHAFDSSAITISSPQIRWGTNRNLKWIGNTAYTNAGDITTGTSTGPFTMHPECWGCEWENNTVTCGSITGGGAIMFDSRSRRSIIQNNKIIMNRYDNGASLGNGLCVGIRTRAHNSVVKNNTVIGGWIGMQIVDHDGCTVTGNVIRDCQTAGIVLRSDNHIVANNSFTRVGQLDQHTSYPGSYNCCVGIYTGSSGHRIVNNDMKKHLNTYSVYDENNPSDVVAINNVMDGYSSGAGFGGPDSSGIESSYGASNWT